MKEQQMLNIENETRKMVSIHMRSTQTRDLLPLKQLQTQELVTQS